MAKARGLTSGGWADPGLSRAWRRASEIATAPWDDRDVARRVSSPEFVGRGPELAALLEALDGVGEGRFKAMFVAGDSGVGKSRLLHEFERRGDERGARVLVGGCVSLAEGELPYAPVRSALRGLVNNLDQSSIDALAGVGREELARLVPELAPVDAVPGTASEAAQPLAQARLFELLLGLLARLAEDEPAVLAIEDIQWADRSTLDLIAFLVSNARHERLLLVCTYRTDELHRSHPLRRFLARHERPPAVDRLDLAPFSRDELSDQLRGILGAAPEPALVDRLHERSGGNAFFTEELLAASEAAGPALPASLRETLMLRIEELGERTQEVLRLAAVHGRVVPHRLLAEATDLPEPELHDALREAASRHVLVREDEATYTFRHALLQEALESDLLPGERVNLHLALAQALERDAALRSTNGAEAAELCVHWIGAQRLPEALGATVEAGLEAERVYAFADASRHFQRALELWERVEGAEERAGMDRAELYARAATAEYLSGDAQEAIRLVRAAIDAADSRVEPYRAALLRERLGRYLFVGLGDTAGARRAYEDAADLLPPDEPRQELARVLGGLGHILMLSGHTRESIEYCERALAVARQSGARAEEGQALNTLGVDLGYLGDTGVGIDHLRESIRIADEVGDLDGLARAYCNLSERLNQDGRIEEAVELALTGAARAGELGLREWKVHLEGDAAARLFNLGRLDEADRLTESVFKLSPSIAKVIQCGARARVELQRGRASEAERLLEEAREATQYVPKPTWTEPLAGAQVELELLRGRPEAAREYGERELELAADEKVVFTARLYALTARAGAILAERLRAAGSEGPPDEAAARTGELLQRIEGLIQAEPWRDPPPETLAYRELCAVEAKRATATASAADWSAVRERWTRLGMRLEEAYAGFRQAEILILDDERELAQEVISAAFATAEECGAEWLRGELEALARRGRLSLPEAEGAARTGDLDSAVERLGLTPREREVLELVAQGMTNRQIGEHLFMSQKTASVHVSRILTKLEVGSRVEAATAAQRLGIVG
jgi:DNA-binding CsgD family transcriptional regulator/tetratricopeptide (TPR) repeat protein